MPLLVVAQLAGCQCVGNGVMLIRMRMRLAYALSLCVRPMRCVFMVSWIANRTVVSWN